MQKFIVSGWLSPKDGRKREVQDLMVEVEAEDHDQAMEISKEEYIYSTYMIHHGYKYYFGREAYDPSLKWLESYVIPEGTYHPRKAYTEEELDRALGVASLCMMF